MEEGFTSDPTEGDAAGILVEGDGGGLGGLGVLTDGQEGADEVEVGGFGSGLFLGQGGVFGDDLLILALEMSLGRVVGVEGGGGGVEEENDNGNKAEV
jgi:hypothetical protein